MRAHVVTVIQLREFAVRLPMVQRSSGLSTVKHSRVKVRSFFAGTGLASR